MERWKINLYTLWVTQVFSLMSFGLGVPFIPYYFQQMGLTDPVQLNIAVGLASTLPAASMAVAAPLWGILSDRYGRKMMIMRAMVCAAILLTMMGVVSTVPTFLFIRFLQGIFTGTITASMAFVSANTPENRMSYALGFMTSSNFLGYAIGPFVGGILAEHLGYSVCFYAGGVLMLIGFVMVLFLVIEDRGSYGPELMARLRSEEKVRGGKKARLFTPMILSVIVTLFIARVARSILTPFVPLFVQDTLGGLSGAATYTGIINGTTGCATAIASLTITRLGDKHNKFKLALLLAAISLPLAALLVPFHSLITFIVLYTVYFFFAGGIEPILTSAASENTSPMLRGALFGTLGTVNSVSLMLAPMLGSFLSIRWGISAIILMIPVFTLIQVLLIYKNRNIGLAVEDMEKESQAEGRETYD